MEGFQNMVSAQLILLIYLGVGMYCRKKGMIDDRTKKKLIDLILKITLPCMIFNSFNKPLTPDILKKTDECIEVIEETVFDCLLG